MDVSEARARREVEQANRLLRDREADHTKEIERLRNAQRKQIRDLEATQAERIEDIRDRADDEVTVTRDRYDEALDDTTKENRETLARERRESYDKFGRLVSESQKERDRDREVQKAQVDNFHRAATKNDNTAKRQYEATVDSLRKKFDDDRHQLKNYFDQKLEEQNRLNSEENARLAAKSRVKVDDAIRSANDRINREKLGSELRYNKLSEEAVGERANLKNATGVREQALMDQKFQSENNLQRSTSRAFEENRLRNAHTIDKLINDNNYQIAQKDQQNSDRLATTENDHRTKEQVLAAQYRKSENDLTSQLRGEKERNDIKNDLNERRHQQDMILNETAMRRSDDLARQIMKERYSSQLQDLEQRNQMQHSSFARDIQRKMANQDMIASNERAEVQREKMKELGDQYVKHNQEKYNLARAYENRQVALEEQSNRQTEDLKRSLSSAIVAEKANSSKAINQNSRESQQRIYELQLQLKNRADEMTAQRESDLSLQGDTNKERLKRVTESYHRALEKQKTTFDENTEAQKHETFLQMLRQREDGDHRQRMQILEMQTKNRALMMNYESKIASIQDQHAKEFDRMKDESDKALRDAQKRAKDTIEGQRLAHIKEIEAKDLLMKEKLKLQEESYKDVIERLKRTNELSLKKS